MRSILDSDEKGRCYKCGRYCTTERHHIYGGPNRKWSEKYGLVVHLCHACHNEPPDGAHFNQNTMLWLRRTGQAAFEVKKVNTTECSYEEARAEFVKIFGKNYL